MASDASRLAAAAQPSLQPSQISREPTGPQWTAAFCIVFRFSFLYLGLLCLTTHIGPGLLPVPEVDIPLLCTLPPIRQIVFWSASHIFRVSETLVYTGSGSGDKTFDWVLAFCLLVVAASGTAIWAILDRKGENYISLHKWFHLFLRFAVGSQMLSYGLGKVVPLQMPFPRLHRLVEPFGNFSPMTVLWSSIGASPGYERFVGSAEVLAAILLFFPPTMTLGALVSLANSIEVFALNMTYDVPVKLYSFNLVLMSLVLLAPELPRMARFFFSNREVSASMHPQLFRTPQANRMALIVQIGFALLLIAGYGHEAWKNWFAFGGGAPKSPLYGIWNVDQLSKDGELQPALVTDNTRWRRVIFERPDAMTLQHMDDTFDNYVAAIDVKAGQIALTSHADKNWKANFHYQRVGAGRLMLAGEVSGHRYQMQLQLLDRSKLLLVSRGFHWIQEYPFNR